MKKVSILLTVVVAITLIFSSCGKYEDGPSFSLLSKTARVANTWVVEKYIDSNGNESDGDTDSWMELKKDGTGSMTYTYNGQTSSLDVQWQFDDSKEKIGLRSKNILTGNWNDWEDDDYATILKLKNDEMWLKDTDGDETHYKTK